MASVFDRVAESLGHGWKGAIGEELKAYIAQLLAEGGAGGLSDEVMLHIDQEITARGIEAVPDPNTPGSYLIGE